jgi:hypothetical protein
MGFPWNKIHRHFDRVLTETKLPDRLDHEAANRFLIKAREQRARFDTYL